MWEEEDEYGDETEGWGNPNDEVIIEYPDYSEEQEQQIIDDFYR